MSVRNLESVFQPKSVALFGASVKTGTVGAVVTRNLLNGAFRGPVLLVNPRHRSIDGRTVYPDVASLPAAPDLAIIATPPETVPCLIDELGARGTKAVVVITAGFGELGERGKALHQAMLEAAQPHLLRIVGPNCVGLLVPGVGLNASFSHLDALPGKLAFVSQSGAMITAMLDWAEPRRIGFSHVVSLGDMADVDFGDVIAYLADDPATEAILLYVEGITHARKFMSAARLAASKKPVLAVKVGKHSESARAAASHTGALAGSDTVYEAAFRRAGILRARTMEELFDAAETLAMTGPQRGNRLAILTNGGGPGVLATDALLDAGGRLAALSPSTIARLDVLLPKTWSRGNPVDIIGDASGERYRAALSVLLEDGETDAVLVVNCPTGVADSIESAHAVIDTIARARATRSLDRNVFTSWLGGRAAGPARESFEAAGIATYDTPDRAVRGFMHRVRFQNNRDLALKAASLLPSNLSVDLQAARDAIRGALDAGREWLDVEDVARLFDAYRIPMVGTRVAKDPSQAAEAAEAIGFPVALKIRSPDITHKTDVGGVALGLESTERVRAEAAAMAQRVAKARPDARQDGFLVQRMANRPGAIELIVGASEDATFGLVVLFGQGGIAVEALQDATLELPPIDDALAHAQIARTRVAKLLAGIRNRPAADLDAIAETLTRVSKLIADHAEIREIDINPLLADAAGVLALDGRVRVEETTVNPVDRLAIRP